MNISITTQNFHLTDDITEFAHSRLADLDKFVPGIKDKKDAEVAAKLEIRKTTEMSGEGNKPGGMNYRLEFTMNADGKQFRSVSTKEDPRVAITEIKDEVQRELKKYKTAVIDKARGEEREYARAQKVDELALGKRTDEYHEYEEEKATL